MAIKKVVHGRESTAFPVPGQEGLLYVVFNGEGPLPDYDISGWVYDRPIGDGGIKWTKISRDYKYQADAFMKQEREVFAKKVSRERGAIYLIQDEVTKDWALWLETWTDYFSRSHTLKAPKN